MNIRLVLNELLREERVVRCVIAGELHWAMVIKADKEGAAISADGTRHEFNYNQVADVEDKHYYVEFMIDKTPWSIEKPMLEQNELAKEWCLGSNH